MSPSASRVAGIGIWCGLAIATSGFVAIFYAWVRVADLISVAGQMPYVVSGGLAGLALVIVGMTVINVDVRRQDGYERRQQLERMGEILADLRDHIEAVEQPEA